MAQYVLSRGTFNSPIQVQIGWGFAILFGVYAGWSTSGTFPLLSFICSKKEIFLGRCIQNGKSSKSQEQKFLRSL